MKTAINKAIETWITQYFIRLTKQKELNRKTERHNKHSDVIKHRDINQPDMVFGVNLFMMIIHALVICYKLQFTRKTELRLVSVWFQWYQTTLLCVIVKQKQSLSIWKCKLNLKASVDGKISVNNSSLSLKYIFQRFSLTYVKYVKSICHTD